MTIDKSSPIRVLHIASGDLWAGAEVQLLTLAKALKNNTSTIVEIILLNHGVLEKKLLSSGINVIVLDESKLNSLIILWKLIRIVRQIQPDVIHTHRIKENILGCVAARLNGNIPTLRTSHGASEHAPSWKQLPKRFIHWLNVICGRYLQQAIIAVSEELAEKLKLDFPAYKIHVIENGIDVEEILKDVTSKSSDQQTDAFKIGFAGRLVPVKRVDIIIKTARYMLDYFPEIKTIFYIYGGGPQQEELEILSHKLKTDEIVFIEGHSEDILKKVQALDALLITSDHEGLPMVLLEGMILGTPIIAHAVGGIPYTLNQGNCGILISDNKPSNYAHAIKQLAESPKKFLKITQLAKQRVLEKYTANANAQAYYLQYRSLLKHSKF
jgi:glycosyltransferase involved in cell wall biosynthesis